MKNNKDFYIGWQEKMPDATRAFLKKVVWGCLAILLLLAFVVVALQKPFSSHVFEFGQVKQFSGTYLKAPLPMLLADPGQVPAAYSDNILLVGYGKFGARGIMENIEKAQGNLSGQQITLAGTLIYGDGKTLLELTDQEAAFIGKNKNPGIPPPTLSAFETISLEGEILDPKCYFGVMKPGEGKIHKSCAIRCISGGIPPVFRPVKNNPSDEYRYFLLLDETGAALNHDILPFVAEQVQIDGKASKLLDWDVLYVNRNQIQLKK